MSLLADPSAPTQSQTTKMRASCSLIIPFQEPAQLNSSPRIAQDQADQRSERTMKPSDLHTVHRTMKSDSEYINNNNNMRRRRRRCATGLSTLSLTCFLSSVFLYHSATTEAFIPLEFGRSNSLHVRNSVVPRPSSSSDSKKKERRSSPLKVRKRVKDVLEKAKGRTGIDNMSDSQLSKSGGGGGGSTILSDAASVGGLNDNDMDVLFNQPGLNGASNGKSKESESPILTPLNGRQVNGKYQRDPQDYGEVADGDSPVAAEYIEPLPFELPKLSQEQIQKLQAGERIQEQSRMGREGSGYVVLDVQAPAYCVWECLLDFESYPELISTVREFQLYTSQKLSTGYVNEKPVLPGTGRETRHYGTPSITRAMFTLSKFRLKIAAIHKYTPHPKGDYMVFTLDPSCTNMVLKGAKGIWHTVENPEGREGWTRVYLLCEVQVSRALPSFIVDYTADRAMPRATTWLRPQVEAAAALWLKYPANKDKQT